MLYTAFASIVRGDFDADLSRFRLINLFLFIVAIVAIGSRVRLSANVLLIAIAALTAWFEPFLSDVRVTNVNGIMVFLLALVFWIRAGRTGHFACFAGGMVLGLAMTFKPVLASVGVVMVLASLLRNRWTTVGAEIGGIVTGGVLGVAVSSLFFGGVNCWFEWFEQIGTMAYDQYTITSGNYGFHILLTKELGFSGNIVSWAMSIGLMFLLAAISLLGRRRRGGAWNPATDNILSDTRTDGIFLGIGVLIYLLASPLVWLHYYLLTVPLILILLTPTPTLQGGGAWMRRLLAQIATILISMHPLMVFFKVEDATTMASLVVTGTLLLLLVSIWELFLTIGMKAFPDKA